MSVAGGGAQVRDKAGASERPFSFDIVLKVAERCNLACRYCYYYFQEYDGDAHRPLMSRAVIDALPGFLHRSLDSLNISGFNIVLHGGEPLLMKRREVDYLCRLLKDQVGGRTDIQFLIQTNGTLVDEAWIALFERHAFRVGVSLDGPRAINDENRIDHAGRGTYDGTLRGLRLLQEAERAGRLRALGAIAVLPDRGDGVRVIEHLVHDLGIHDPNLNFPHAGWDTPAAVAWGRNIEALRPSVRYVLERLIYPELHYVRGVTNVLLALKSEKGAAYNDERIVHRHHIATISSEGAVLGDDNMLGVDPDMAESGLDVFRHSLSDLVVSEPWRKMNQALDTPAAACADCRWWRVCRGGDLFNRFSRADGFARPSVLCEVLQMIHEEAEAFLTGAGLVAAEDLEALLTRPPVCSAADSLRVLLSRPAAAAPPGPMVGAA